MPRSPAPGHGSSRTFSQKLGIYLLGVAIGLVIFGWFQLRKRQAAAYQQQQQAETESAAAPASEEAQSPPDDRPGG
ncbi:MAG: hypothetical protein RIB60_11780 [Phycisphaerales bacterium]